MGSSGGRRLCARFLVKLAWVIGLQVSEIFNAHREQYPSHRWGRRRLPRRIPEGPERGGDPSCLGCAGHDPRGEAWETTCFFSNVTFLHFCILDRFHQGKEKEHFKGGGWPLVCLVRS
jgi:hypothetical protein